MIKSERSGRLIKWNMSQLISFHILLIFLSSQHSLGQSHWEWKTPIPPTQLFRSITYGDSLYVSVGFRGSIYSSTDGISWQIEESNTKIHLNSIAYGLDKFVTVGEKGTILSRDRKGTQWKHVESKTTSDLLFVIYNNDVFYACGNNGVILTSSDSKNWVRRETFSSFPIKSIAYGNNMFIATSENTLIFVSSNGIEWSNKDIGYFEVNNVIFGNGVFIIAINDDFGSLLLSQDGINWTKTESGVGALCYVTFCNGQFIGRGWRGDIVTSIDGIVWEKRSKNSFSSIVYGLNKYVGVASGAIYISPDIAQWTKTTIGTINHLFSVIYGKGRFVAVGDNGTIIYSIDGTTWTESNSGTNAQLWSVEYFENNFIAVGQYGIVLSSSDGMIWKKDSLNVGGESGYLNLVIRGKDNIMTSGSNGEIYTSLNGNNWTLKSMTKPVNCIAFSNDGYVAVTGISIFTSQDGSEWIPCDSETPDWFENLVYIPNLYIAHSSNHIYSSSDRRTWLLVNSVLQNQVLTAITNSKKQYIIMGTQFDTIEYFSNALIALRSTDGKRWETFIDTAKPAIHQINSIAYGNGLFVAVGHNGVILTSVEDSITACDNNDLLKVQHIDRSLKIKCTTNQIELDLFLSEPTNIRLKIFNSNGQLVRSFFDNHKKSGDHIVSFDIRTLASGVYFLELITSKNYVVNKLVIK